MGAWIQTVGFREAGDGGGAIYEVRAAGEGGANGADVIDAGDGLVAVLVERQAVNYRMFGAVGDGETDDGVAIKRAHEYAGEHGIPVVNRSGEFWIKETNRIPIHTSVDWGQTVFHIDELHNTRRDPRFVVHNDGETVELVDDAALKRALIEKARPGVQIIPELAPYAGCLVNVMDDKDRIGIRAGNYSKRGWAREELFYVEEEGKLVGDIAWSFTDLTSIKVKPCNDTYLVIEGGGFRFSGDCDADSDEKGYRHHGISIERSRTVLRNQWMGLEEGRSDDSMHPRSGFYRFSGVYDVTLENIRAMPWEKNREDPARVLWAGTYGIGGARMLNCTFRNITAEGGWVAWGVFGTNLNKNFRVENCRLNRIDVHFHCWNLYIKDCTIGYKGISVTGGGDLFIDNTVRHGTNFVSFRPDYGAKWDGDIRLRGCTLKPSGDRRVVVLSCRPHNFDYQYPIGYGRTVVIEDLKIDYAAAPDSTASCLLMQTASFSRTDDGTRLFFPHRIAFRDVSVEGRATGVRLIEVPEPDGYQLLREGGYDGSLLRANCEIVCDNVDLERSDDPEVMHLVLGGGATDRDSRALFPNIRFRGCDGVRVSLGDSVGSVSLERCGVSAVSADGLRGEIAFSDCHVQAEGRTEDEVRLQVESELGTRFTNCTLHAPVVNGETRPEAVGSGVLEVNGEVRHQHLQTRLSRGVMRGLEGKGVGLEEGFVGKLRVS